MRTPFLRIRTGAVSLVLIFIGAVCAYHQFGSYSLLEAIWMVVVTISTVGYSEHTESSVPEQIITILLIISGVSAAAYTCGGFIQLALEGEVERVLGKRKMTREISKLRDHIVICGFGRLGYDLMRQLNHRNKPVVVIDHDPEKIIIANEQNILSVTGDATDEHVLESCNLPHAKAIVTALPSDAENVFITLTARNLCPEIQIIAKAEHQSSVRKLRQAGANKVVMPHRVGAHQMERMISRPNTADLVEFFAETSELDMELDELTLTESSDLIGKSLAQAGVREQFSLLVVGVKNGNGEFQFNPGANLQINAGDTLLVMGRFEDIQRMKSSHA